MRIVGGPDQQWNTRQGDARQFSGRVWQVRLFESDSEDLRIGCVTFEPGSRTHWHSHPGGQLLLILTGSGWVGGRTGRVEQVTAGHIAYTPPEEPHWHGASDSAFLAHIAITRGETNWMEEVSSSEMPTDQPKGPGTSSQRSELG